MADWEEDEGIDEEVKRCRRELDKKFESMRNYKSDEYHKFQFQPLPRDDTIRVNIAEKVFFAFILIIQLSSTLMTIGVIVSSAFKDKSEVVMSRSSYWWLSLYCLLLLVTSYQIFLACIKPKDNFDDFTCSFILTLICLVIQVVFLLLFDMVQFPLGDQLRKL